MITTKTNTIKNIMRKVLSAAIIASLVVLPLSFAGKANALAITNKQIALSSAAGGATGVTYTFSTTAALPSTTTPVKSLKIQFCVAIATCGSLTGFSSSGASLAGQPTGLGAGSGWTINAGAANELRVQNASNVTNPTGNVSVAWNGVVNPTANNTTFYALITTYSDSFTTAVDSGTVALSTAQAITVSLAVNESLTFCAGTTITGQNCGTVSGNAVNLGTGSVSSTSTGTSVLSGSTNATNGYVITFAGSALGPLTSMTGAASAIGTSQFGLNLAANATPAVGTARSGTGTASAFTGYGTADSFKYVPGTIASVGVPTDGNTFTVSYIANISGTVAPGNYSTAITYIATANF